MKLEFCLLLVLAAFAFADDDDEYGYPSEEGSSSDSYGSDDDSPNYAGSDSGYNSGPSDDGYGSSEDSYDGDGDSSGPSDYDDRRKRSVDYTLVSGSFPYPVVRVRRGMMQSSGGGGGGGVGPVHTHVKTDYHGNFKWGVRHRVGGGGGGGSSSGGY